MAYATVEDLQARLTRDLTADEIAVATTLLDDAAVVIDASAPDAQENAKRIVSCRMVIRALGDGESNGFPIGATQGSMGGLGYTQSWTIGGSGANGELYLNRMEKKLLGIGNRVGSYSPVEDISEAGDSLA